jgi:threonine dehydratase
MRNLMHTAATDSSLPTTETEIHLEDVRAAADIVHRFARHTPLLTSRRLSELTGCRVLLKAEPFQRTGSYKIRGPLYKLSRMQPEALSRGVICSSAGNHAQGVAAAAQAMGIPAVVVMATGATPSKVEATRGYGAEVVLHGEIWEDANARASELAAQHGYTYIHPFDDADLITGQATLGLEILDDCPEVDMVIAPIGGGGLLSGVSSAIKAGKPATTVIGVESSGAPAAQASVQAGTRITLDRLDTKIDGLKVRQIGRLNFELMRRNVDEFVSLPDEEIFEGLRWIMHNCKIVVEGAAAAPVAALLQKVVKPAAGSTVVCVLSGGNLDLSSLAGRTWN